MGMHWVCGGYALKYAVLFDGIYSEICNYARYAPFQGCM